MIRVTPSGSVVPFKCVVCGKNVDGPDAEYVDAVVVDDKERTVYKPKDSVRRHFLSESHAITLRDPIDYRPVPVVLSMGRV